jgi:ribosomal protein S3AE
LKEESLSVTDLKIPAEVPDGEARKLKAMAWATGKILQAQSSSIGKILRYAVNTSGSYLDYAGLAIKSYGTAEAV